MTLANQNKSEKLFFYRIFLVLFFLSFLAPYFDFIYYDILIAAHFFKIPFVGSVVLATVFHLRHGLRVTVESVLFLFFGLFSFVYGVMTNDNIGILFSHVYVTAMPILCISFGMHFAEDFDQHMQVVLQKILIRAFYFTVGALAIYYYLFFVKQSYPYFGFGTGMPLIGAFLLIERRYLKFFFGLVMTVFSGKRTSLILMLLTIPLCFIKQLKYFLFSFKGLFVLALTVIIGCAGFNYAMKYDLLRRFKVFTEIDFSNENILFVATGGRWQEVTSITRHFNEKPIRWFVGAGMGGKYEVEEPQLFSDQGLGETRHYAHFSPAGYTFLFGLPFAVLLYGSFLYKIFIGLRFLENFFFLGFVLYFLNSLFGAVPFVDPKFWFFLGFVAHILRNKRLHQSNSLRALPQEIAYASGGDHV